MKNALFILVCTICFSQTLNARQRLSRHRLTSSTAGIVVAPVLVAVERSHNSIIVAPRYVDPTNSRLKTASGFQEPFGSQQQVGSSQKLRFRDRVAMKMLPKWAKPQRISALADSVDADRLAVKSRKAGILAISSVGLAALLLIIGIPAELGGLILLAGISMGFAIGFSIAAMVSAKKARKLGSKKKDGRGFGRAIIITIGLFFTTAIIALLAYAGF